MAARIIFRVAAGLFGFSVLQCILQKCGLDLPARAIKQSIDENFSVYNKWDSSRLQQIAVDPRMKTTMTLAIHGPMDGSRTVANPSQTLKERIDSIPVMDIRTAMLMSLTRTNVKKDDFAKFARLDNPEVTCATTGTAGEDGVDRCTEQCHQRSHFWSKMPDEGACYALCSVAVHPCTRKATRGDWSTRTMTVAKTIADMVPMGETVTKVLATTVSSVSTIAMSSPSYAWASDSMATIRRGVETGIPHGGKVAFIVLCLGVVGLTWKQTALARTTQRDAREVNRRADTLSQVIYAGKLKRLMKVRKKAVMYGAFDDIHLAGAWNICHSMKQETARAKKAEACKVLERLAYQHERRKKAVKFTQWKGAVVTLKAVDEVLGRK